MTKSASRAGFVALLAYMTIDFVRPQDWFPVLGAIRPGLLLALAITFYWMKTWGPRELFGDKLLTLFAMFATLCALWVPFAVNNYWALQMALVLIVLLLAAAVPLGLYLISEARRRRFLNLWIAVHCYLACYSIFNMGRGPGSFLGDENDLALALCMCLPYPYLLAQHSAATKRTKLIYYAADLLMLIGIVWTHSRGGFVGLVFVAFYMFWLSKNRIRNLILAAILGGAVFAVTPDSYIEEVGTITDTTESTARQRILMWRIGWVMFEDNPIFGVGPGNYPYRANEYQATLPDYVWGDRMYGGRVSHSLYFTVIPELGIAGIVLFLLIVFGIVRRLKHSERMCRDALKAGDAGAEVDILLARAMRASLIGYLSAGAFISVLYYPPVWYTLGFVVALSRSAHGRLARVAQEAERLEPADRSVAKRSSIDHARPR